MDQDNLIRFLQFTGKDPARLIFEDELTDIYNRRFLLQYFQQEILWDQLEKDPVSLIMIDVDHFKRINDTYGHPIGDQLLIWIAHLMRQVAGDDGLPIRYAGDEFMILLHHRDKAAALPLGKRLIDETHRQIFRPVGSGPEIRISLSVGIASAPEDAITGQELIHQADMALYTAKKTGRDCFVNAKDVSPEKVFDKTFVHQLQNVKLVGRKQQLARITEALNEFSQEQNQLLILEGPAGIGKSELLAAIHRNLARIKLWRIRTGGEPQEAFRPYYLITKILIAFLNEQPDKGTRLIERLGSLERTYLSAILPQLTSQEANTGGMHAEAMRQGIFLTILHFFLQLAADRPVTLFIDDLHFADEATLLLLRQLKLQNRIPVFICGSSMGVSLPHREDQQIPLERFQSDFSNELGIKKLALPPLNEDAIRKHLQTVFPGADFPAGFVSELARVSKGNPLFLSEILRKLVLDQQITLVGQQWLIAPLQENYLPSSLDDIIERKIAALDDDQRTLLDQMAALGENLSLSMLIGSTGRTEADVLAFIDEAAAQGLLSTHFQLNDEVVRFMGKRIRDIAYDAIDHDRKQAIHQRIGNYQEGLYQQQLILSAAPLSYHFKRSRDSMKAANYENLQTAVNQRNFDSQAAFWYSLVDPDEEMPAEDPLQVEDLALIPRFIRLLMIAVRNIRLYPAGSKSITIANQKLNALLAGILQRNPQLSLAGQNRAVLVNGQRLDVSDFKLLAEGFLQLMGRFELQGLVFYQGVRSREVNILLHRLAQTRQKILANDFWQQFASKNNIAHIELRQIRYALKMGRARISGSSHQDPALQDDLPLPSEAPEPARQLCLHPAELELIPEIVKTLGAAFKTVRLYPLESQMVQGAIHKILKLLWRFFSHQSLLALARTQQTLLVNGQNLGDADLAAYRRLFVNFAELMHAMGWRSVAFRNRISFKQLQIFIGAVRNLPGQPVDIQWWHRLAREYGLSDICFDQHLYEIQVHQHWTGKQTNQAVHDAFQGVAPAVFEPLTVSEQFKSLLDGFDRHLEELYFAEDHNGVDRQIIKLFSNFQDRTPAIQKEIVTVCRTTIEKLPMAQQHDFGKRLVNPLLHAFDAESDPHHLAEIAVLLKRMTAILVQSAEYSTAAHLLNHLHRQYQRLRDTRVPQAQVLLQGIIKLLSPSTQSLLIEDLNSGDPIRHQNAANLLGSFGQVAMPILIDMLKREEGLRARRVAAALIRKLGPHAIAEVKRHFQLEIGSSERRRILEVIELMTPDFYDEVVQSLRDDNPRVREAAYRLAEAAKSGNYGDALLTCAKSENHAVAIGAIRCIGRLKLPNAGYTLSELLGNGRDLQIQIACCRAMGQIAAPVCIESLLSVLQKKGFWIFRHRVDERLRIAAASALAQISDPRALASLIQLSSDNNPDVREIALRASQAPMVSTTAKNKERS